MPTGALAVDPDARVTRAVPARMQASVTVSTDISEAEWDSYVHHHRDATVDHLWGWRRIFGDVFRQRCEYLVARRGTDIAGVLPLVLFRSLLFGRFGVSVPYLNYGGILASDQDAAAALVDRATALTRDFGGSHLELRHQGRQLPAAPCREHKVRMLLELSGNAEDLWQRLDRKVRNQVRKAQKEALVASHGGAELLSDFYAVFARNMRDLGTPVHSQRFFTEVMREFRTAEIHVVEHQGQPVAASLTIRFRDVVLVPWASSLREHRHLCPNMLLYWSMLCRAVEGGARAFDFGRSTRGAGTHQFKLQWGAEEIPLHWEYVLLTRAEAPDQGPGNSKLAWATAAWQRLPLMVSRHAGPLIIQNIP